jgi:hypothetical protein
MAAALIWLFLHGGWCACSRITSGPKFWIAGKAIFASPQGWCFGWDPEESDRELIWKLNSNRSIVCAGFGITDSFFFIGAIGIAPDAQPPLAQLKTGIEAAGKHSRR